MGLFDGYFDPQQFGEGGGLLGRLLALQQLQGQYQLGEGFDPRASTTGQVPSLPVDSAGKPQQDLHSQYQALRSILGDRDAMLAIVHPKLGRTLIAQARAGQTTPGNIGNADSPGVGQTGPGTEASSTAAGQPPGLSKVGYVETPTNANQAAGELQSIQERKPEDVVSGKDYVSGVREGNIKQNEDGSLDVTNGTIVTFSHNDGHAKTVTVTNTDIAHIDGKTGEVVIQKSPLDERI